MTTNRPHHQLRLRSFWLTALVGIIGLSAVFTAIASAQVASPQTRSSGSKPTVVIVHGAWADASGFSDVIERLQRQGYPVIAPANPLRGLASDAAYLASVLATLPGPLVVVGHSYGGAVSTNAATGNPNVKALVYVAAFVPDAGQTLLELVAHAPGSQLVPPGQPGATLLARPFPAAGGGTGLDLYIVTDHFRQIFAGDVPAKTAAVMAATQRPLPLSALQEQSGPPAWKSIPSWAMVATHDNAIGTANVLFMAQHAGAHIVEVNGPHAVMVSHPDPMADLIVTAARATT